MADFTTDDEIQRLLGEDGYDDYMQDLTASEITSFIGDAIDYANQVITSYTQEFYLDDNISNLQILRSYATTIACHFLSQRRGNATLYEGQLERAYEYLENVRSQKINLPGMITMRVEAPIVRNHVINQNYRETHFVDPNNSTGTHADEKLAPGSANYFGYPN